MVSVKRCIEAPICTGGLICTGDHLHTYERYCLTQVCLAA